MTDRHTTKRGWSVVRYFDQSGSLIIPPDGIEMSRADVRRHTFKCLNACDRLTDEQLKRITDDGWDDTMFKCAEKITELHTTIASLEAENKELRGKLDE